MKSSVTILISLMLSAISQFIVMRNQFSMYMPGYSGVGIEPMLFSVINAVLFPFLWLVNYANVVMICRVVKLPYGKRELLLTAMIPVFAIFVHIVSPFILSAKYSAVQRQTKQDYNIQFATPEITITPDGSCSFSWPVTNNFTGTAKNAEINFYLWMKTPDDPDSGSVHLCATNMRMHQDLVPGVNTITGTAEPSHYNDRKNKARAGTLPVLAGGYVKINHTMFLYEESLGDSVAAQVRDNLDVWFMPR